MSVAARSIRFPHNMALAGDLHEDFNALGIRCRSTSCSAPEMNCPSMTFSTSSSETTTTETENETPPLSPSESATQSTPKLKFAFDLDGDLEGFWRGLPDAEGTTKGLCLAQWPWPWPSGFRVRSGGVGWVRGGKRRKAVAREEGAGAGHRESSRTQVWSEENQGSRP